MHSPKSLGFSHHHYLLWSGGIKEVQLKFHMRFAFFYFLVLESSGSVLIKAVMTSSTHRSSEVLLFVESFCLRMQEYWLDLISMWYAFEKSCENLSDQKKSSVVFRCDKLPSCVKKKVQTCGGSVWPPALISAYR